MRTNKTPRPRFIGCPLLCWVALILLLDAARALDAAEAGTPITALSFSPDGKHLVASGTRSVQVCSILEGTNRPIQCDLARVQSIAIHPSGSVIAVGGGTPGSDGAFQLIDWAAGRVTWTSARRTDVVTSVAFNPAGTRLVIGSSDAQAEKYDFDAATGGTSPQTRLNGHSGPVLAVAYSPDSRIITTASADRTIKVWEANNGRLVRSLNHHTATVHCLAFRPSQESAESAPRPAFCASASDDMTVRVWQPEIGRMVRIIRSHGGAIFAVAYSPDGSVLFSAGKEGIVRVIDAESDAILREWKASDDWIYAIAISPKGQMLATGDWTGELKLWNSATGERLPCRAQLEK